MRCKKEGVEPSLVEPAGRLMSSFVAPPFKSVHAPTTASMPKRAKRGVRPVALLN